MANDSRYLIDFNLCQECLEGNSEAITSLRDRFGNAIAAYLVHAGAAPHEAAEIVDSLWADLLVPGENQPPRLARYCGTSALQTWLNVVALNRLLSRKRVEQRWQQIIPARVEMPHPEHENNEARPWRVDPSVSSQQVDVVLIDLMRAAIETAFLSCEPEDFVLLQLKHCDELRGAELARMFACDESTISRRISKAEQHIAVATLLHIRKTDPWLDLKWADFLELCGTATPACFGLD